MQAIAAIAVAWLAQRRTAAIARMIDAATAAETAVSIVAEIIATRTDRTGVPLAATTGRISG